METDTTVTETVDTVVTETVAKRPLDEMFQEVQNAEFALQAAQVAYEASLTNLAKMHSPTFCLEGQWRQIRTRPLKTGGKLTYICELDAEPKTWLKGRPKKTVELPVVIGGAFDAVPARAQEVASETVFEPSDFVQDEPVIQIQEETTTILE